MSNRLVCPLWLVRIFPFIRWWNRVDRHTLRSDSLAGLIGAIVVLPQGVAFAAIAGMPPEYGLYAGMVPAIVAALWGSSWHLVSGPTTAASLVLFASISSVTEPESTEFIIMALTLTFMVGVIQLAMGLAKLGALVNFISHSVIIGFTAGAAILIAVNQLKHFFGVSLERSPHFFEIISNWIGSLEETNLYVTAVGLTTLVFGVLTKKFFPKIPYMIVAMLVGGVTAAVLNSMFGADLTKIPAMNALPAALPPLSSPDFSIEVIKELAPAALAVTLFALVEAVSIARSLAIKSGQHVDGNQEFIGQGLSNITGSFFSGYVATGSFNRSGLNFEAGAKTPLAAVFAGVLLIVVVLFVAPLVQHLPYAAMAAILFMVAWSLIDFYHIKRILKHSKSESSILITTFLATLTLELEFAIFLGVMLSLVLYLNRTSKPKIYARVPDERLPNRKFNTDASLPECPQLKLVRIDGSLFFGAISHVRESLANYEQQNPQQKNILLLAQGINFIDLEGGEFLEKESLRRRKAGGKLFLYRVKEGVCEQLRKNNIIATIGNEHIFHSKTEALNVIVNQHLDKAVCATCTHRIFKECANLPKPDDSRKNNTE